MIEARINKDKMVFIKGLTQDPGLSFLKKSKKSDWYYSSFYWLDDIRKSLNISISIPELAPFEKKFLSTTRMLQEGAVYSTDVFDKMFAIPLWESQKHAASVMAYAGRFIILDLCGLGKSASTLGALMILFAKQKIKNVLIVTTASTIYQWKLEIRKFLKEEYHSLYPIQIIEGSRAERIQALSNLQAINIIGYESLVRTFPFEFSPALDCVVTDEQWKIKNWKTKTWRTLKQIFRDTLYRFGLNASPIGNNYTELFGPVDLIDPAIFVSWRNFKDRYCVTSMAQYPIIKRGKFAGMTRPILQITGYKNINDLKRRMASFSLRRIPKQMGWKTPQLVTTNRWVELSKEQRCAYNSIRNSRELDGLAKIVRTKIVCLFDSSNPIDNTVKFIELKSFVLNEVPDEKIVVFSESKMYLEAVFNYLYKLGVKTRIISSEVTNKDRERIKGEFSETSNVRVLLCTAAGETGLNLQAANIVVNLDLPYNAERLKQRIGRVRPYLGGEGRRILVVNILARNTIEEKVIEKIQYKVNLFSKLFGQDQIDLGDMFKPEELIKLL